MKASPHKSVVGRPVANPNWDAREILLNAAVKLIGEHGVAATTFAMIAKRAGMTPAMLHYYFKDREALIDAVVDERIAAVIATVWEPVKPTTEPEAMVSGIVSRLVAGVQRYPWIPSTWMREILNDEGLLRSRVLRHLPFDKVRLVSESVARGQRSGAINAEIDPVLIVFSTIGLVMLHMATLRFFAETFHRKVPNDEEVCRHITAVLLNGMLGRPRAGKRKLQRAKRRQS
jgi:AcrR family transcriptional regulator